MAKKITLTFFGALISLFSLFLIAAITLYAGKEGDTIAFYFLIIPSVFLLIGILILRNGIRLKLNPEDL